ncbi:D-amino acid dehydrogenase [Noviherbaspirillum sp.]|uniref:D-amino acid dehydrogenase n=1 Tax=Noviherbaspirillum sp. TaxID=1926288 RepID=UPI002FE3B10C
MKTLVLGAGVIGLSAAYYLRADGHDVTVVDRNHGVGLATSYANGGQLSYSYVAPLAGPGVLPKLPPWLLRSDAPMRFSPDLDIEQWRWCIEFVMACTQHRSDLTTRRLLALSFLSRRLMEELRRSQPDLQFDFKPAGKLVLHRDPASFAGARRLLDYQRSLGCEQEALDTDACVALEPALAHAAGGIAGGIYTRSEDSADCYQFCVGLESILRKQGVRFLLNTAVDRIVSVQGGNVQVISGGGVLDADHIVVALGASSPSLLKPLGIRLPIYPLKGYSLTVPVSGTGSAPSISVTDFQRKVVYARLGDRLRIAGMADLTGRRLTVDPRRIDTLKAEARAVFPGAGDYDAATVWAGQRPATPSGNPILGRTRYRNLWLNVGQGGLGFTLALASGHTVTNLLAGRAAAVPLDGFELQR